MDVLVALAFLSRGSALCDFLRVSGMALFSCSTAGASGRANGKGLAAGGLRHGRRAVRGEKRETYRRRAAANCERTSEHQYVVLYFRASFFMFCGGCLAGVDPFLLETGNRQQR